MLQEAPRRPPSRSRGTHCIPHAGSDEPFCGLRKVAAARARGARRPSGAEEGICGELAQPQTARREPAPARAGGSREPGPEAHARRATRRGRVSLLPPPSLRSDGEPSWGRVRLPHQPKHTADLGWSSSGHSECLTCGRARYILVDIQTGLASRPVGPAFRCDSSIRQVLHEQRSVTHSKREVIARP